jgi:hypothetical protein
MIDGRIDHEADEPNLHLDRPAGINRRGLLAGAASGFALAASGLLLPEWQEEVEAREGAYGGRLGGRHGGNRRGRDC